MNKSAVIFIFISLLLVSSSNANNGTRMSLPKAVGVLNDTTSMLLTKTNTNEERLQLNLKRISALEVKLNKLVKSVNSKPKEKIETIELDKVIIDYLKSSK